MALNKKYLSYLFVISITFLVQGCALIMGQAKDPNAFATPVKVISVKENFAFTGSGVNGFYTTRYIVRDAKGRDSVVMARVGEHQPGACLTLWRGNMNKYPYYPRLSTANSDCSVLKSEPDYAAKTYIYKPQNIALSDFYQWYSVKMETWLDASVEDLVRAWGAPIKSYRSDVASFLTYANQRTTTYTQYNYLGNVTNSSSASYHCETTFEIRDGLVYDYSWRGNNCL